MARSPAPRRPALLVVAALVVCGLAAAWLFPDSSESTEHAPVRSHESAQNQADRTTADDLGGARDGMPVAPPRTDRPTVGTLAGEVVTSDGAPVSGAQVTIDQQPLPGFAALPAARTLRTDAEGHFEAQALPPGLYALVALHEGLVSDRRSSVTVGPGARTEGVRLVLEPGATLVGSVRDAADGSSISTCSVRMGPRTVPCDHAGRFQLGPLAPGGVLLRVTAPGYAPREVAVELARRARLTADVLLSRGATLSGVVLDPDRRPFAGARVRSAHYSVDKTPISEVETTSDAQGRFVLEGVAEGRVSARAEAPGFAEAASSELTVVPGETKEGIQLVLSTGGAIAGTVVQRGGVPVEGAQVRALRLSDREVVARDQSSSDGSFRLDGLSPGEYTVVAETAFARGLAPGVQVTLREEAQVSVILGSDRVSGRVLDPSGNPVSGALVSAVSAYGAGQGAQSTTTDREGRFVLEGLVGSPFRVQAQAGAKGTVERRGVAAGSEVELRLEEGGRIEGVITDGRGQGLNDFELALLPSDPARTGSVAQGFRTLRLLSPDGSFRIDEVPAGRYRLRAKAPRLVEAETQLEVPAGGRATASLQLKGGGTVRGRVLQGETPVAGCRVDPGAWSATTDAQGRFELVGVPTGRIAVWTACPDGRWGGNRVEVAEGETREATIQLHAAEEGRRDGPSEFGGVGAGLRQLQDGRVVVSFVSEGGPAFLAGLQRGDEVLAVDGWLTQGQALAEVIHRIRGPTGTPVRLSMRREATGAVWDAFPERVRITLD